MSTIKLTLKHQVRVVDEYWEELGRFDKEVTAEMIYKWVSLKYNCIITHHSTANGTNKSITFKNDKDLTFFILKHGQ
jgi:hypothetical protein